ncbi:AsnC family protein [Amycolatopsis sp. FDAARGOS 1241]|uniref:AsnC family protein n=1 Tax=Amycolatopsis sp. FDAARGOS 1241 TaxID=2778070 RepID=UPI00194F1E29|nr:AsnC family protein [Amycolatopsis sp. FDAARGOS 1241]QRP48789.1 AsnC family transcriptional regulator [Amycolatopsis sp. FDAARGOS 1241]
MAVTDPVDVRLLAALAEAGTTAVHDLAAKVGMDPREVAYRLVSLSGSGLPLLVGVESDPAGLRAAIAGAPASWQEAPPSGGMPVVGPGGRPGPPTQPGAPHGPQPGVPAGQVFPAGMPPSGPMLQAQHAMPAGPGPQARTGLPSGPPPGAGSAPGPAGQPVPSGGAPSVHGGPSGTVRGVPSGPYGAPSGPYGVPSGQFAAQPGPAPDPVLSTWGVPQTASWARGDGQRRGGPAEGKHGRIGEPLPAQGLEGEQLTIQLLEVQDPADFLFGAAGYRLEEGERAVVVHTEITNRGAIPFASLPDNYLELVTADGTTVAKAPVSLTSRPPHKIGVRPGETLGGHTVYVLPEAVRVVSVRWSPRPEPDERSLTWTVEG